MIERLKIGVEFKPQDLWVGVFWKTHGHERDFASKWHHCDIWICLIPCVPIHIKFIWCTKATATARLVAALKQAEQLIGQANAGAFENGVTDPTNTIDQGDVYAGQVLSEIRAALAAAEVNP